MAAPPKDDYVPKNILVTGAAGFIASNFVNRVMRLYPNYNIVVLDKFDYCSSIHNLYKIRDKANVHIIKGDIQSAELVNHILEQYKIDTIMHFAAQSHVDNSFLESVVFTEDNVLGTHILLEGARQSGTINRFIHVSTDEVYGENDASVPNGHQFDEELSRMNPTNPYAATKAAAEMLCQSYAISHKLPLIITRGNNVYGPHQYPEKLIPKFINLAMNGCKMTIHGDGSQHRSYMYAEDAASAFCFVLHRGKLGEIYNVGTVHERSVMSVAKDIAAIFNLDPEKQIVHVRDRNFNDAGYMMSNEKLVALGWKEETTWEEGLRLTAQWYKTHSSHWPNVASALSAHPGDDVKECKSTKKERFLVFGKNGWLGGSLGKILAKDGENFKFSARRLEDRTGIIAEIEKFKPTHILNAACVTGALTIDWCESHHVETLRTNVIGVLTLADICEARGIHMTNFATGCIYDYDKKLPEGSGKGFKEEDKPNFHGSFFSHTMATVEDLLNAYSHVLNLRMRLPISEDLEMERNLIYKISHYEKVVNIPNSITVLPELLPMSVEMAKRGLTGIYNFTNPGVISHNECLELYKQYYKPDFTWENFTVEEQAKVIVAPRPNNELDCTKLKKEFPDLLSIKESLIKFVFEPNKKKC